MFKACSCGARILLKAYPCKDKGKDNERGVASRHNNNTNNHPRKGPAYLQMPGAKAAKGGDAAAACISRRHALRTCPLKCLGQTSSQTAPSLLEEAPAAPLSLTHSLPSNNNIRVRTYIAGAKF